ncbi:transcriptional regulator TetR family [Klebsiella pneumoniae]|nr:transcriptional regulator TetR family [Klebsiella pneumoniae]
MARPKSEDKKQALLEAATAAFAQSGIAASTSAIARSAGVAEGTLFRYFATKDELLNELYLAIKLRPEESPDDLQINHQIRVEAHLVA